MRLKRKLNFTLPTSFARDSSMILGEMLSTLLNLLNALKILRRFFVSFILLRNDLIRFRQRRRNDVSGSKLMHQYSIF